MKTSLKILVSILALVCILATSGCNTAEGFGKDLQQGGKSIQKAANESY